MNYIPVRSIHSLVAAVSLAATSFVAQAVPFSSALNVEAWVDFDETSSFAAGTNQGGEISSTIGGVTTGSTITGASTTTASLGGTLTDLGDGLGTAFNMSGSNAGEEGGLFSDYLFNLTNTSATDQYLVSFRIDLFNNLVDADGTDAYADSQVSIFDETNATEVFFSDLTSDTFFGDLFNGSDAGTFGALLSETGIIFTFDVLIDPLASFELSGINELQGGVFDDFSSFNGELSSFVSIAAVRSLAAPVPEPHILLLLTAGLLGIACLRRYSAHC